VIVNYVAAYQFNTTSSTWRILPEMSFNVEGECGPTDLVNDQTSWLQTQPGGSAGWEAGVYVPNVPGVGPPAMLFVLSVEKFLYAAWYILNQSILNRGPASANPACGGDNCWADGSAGEIDFLESPFWDTYYQENPSLYSRLFATSFNGAGRCFPNQNKPAGCSGGDQTTSYFMGDDAPHIFAAVVDGKGVTIYRDTPWTGLTNSTAASSLPSRPSSPPSCNTPPCDSCSIGESCALFMPGCANCTQATGCPMNWWSYFVDTQQYAVANSIAWPNSNGPPPCECSNSLPKSFIADTNVRGR